MFYKSEITSLLLKRIFTFFSKNKSDIRKFTAFWIFEIPIFENLEKITPRIKKKKSAEKFRRNSVSESNGMNQNFDKIRQNILN